MISVRTLDLADPTSRTGEYKLLYRYTVYCALAYGLV